MEDPRDDIYNTELYTDFTDLPKQTQKALFKEFRKSSANENKIYVLTILAYIIFAVAIAGFMTASIFVYIFVGISILFVLMLILILLTILGFLILKTYMDRVGREQKLRFAEWLRINKHVIAELKEDKK